MSIREHYESEELELAIQYKELQVEKLKSEYAYCLKHKILEKDAEKTLQQISQIGVEIEALKKELAKKR